MPLRPYRLLFVCTGNVCRSPMAAAFATEYAKTRQWPVTVLSASVIGLNGALAAKNAIRAMREIDIDISDHRSTPLDRELVDWADYILVMELGHQISIHKTYSGTDGKVLMLGAFGGLVEVRDPLGSWRWRFRRSRNDIMRCVRGFMDQLPPPTENPEPT